MEHREIHKIQGLVNDQNFRNQVLNSNPDIKISQHLQSEFENWSIDEMEIARRIVLSLDQDEELSKESNKDQIWFNVVKSVNEFDQLKTNTGGQAKSRVTKDSFEWGSLVKYAAVFIGLAMAFTWGVFYKSSDTNQAAEVAQVVTKSNPSGQKSRIQLSDGSVVHLNAESELRYTEGFNKGQRKIHLRGEAYFEVAKDQDRPFTVVTDRISVTALGTEFNVNTFKKDIQVALIEGSVLVNNPANNDQVILRPSEVLSFVGKGGLLKKDGTNALDLISWKNRIIYFDNTPLDEAMKILSRWYAVDLDIGNLPKQALTCSGKFDDSSLELVLKNLGYALGFEYKIEGKNVTLDFND